MRGAVSARRTAGAEKFEVFYHCTLVTTLVSRAHMPIPLPGRGSHVPIPLVKPRVGRPPTPCHPTNLLRAARPHPSIHHPGHHRPGVQPTPGNTAAAAARGAHITVMPGVITTPLRAVPGSQPTAHTTDCPHNRRSSGLDRMVTLLSSVFAQACSCASDSAAASDLLYCRSTGDPHYTAFDGRNFNFMATGIFQLAHTDGACACSDHDNVEVQTFMCGPNAGRKGVSYNNAVAVRVGGVTLIIDSTDDRLVVSGDESATVAPSRGSYSFGAVRVSRELHELRGSSRGVWRVNFPGGGSLLSVRFPSRWASTGAFLNLWTSLPQTAAANLTGLCAASCTSAANNLQATPCGRFVKDVKIVGYALGNCFFESSAFTCAQRCWQEHSQNDAVEVYFTWRDTSSGCCCKSAPEGYASVPPPDEALCADGISSAFHCCTASCGSCGGVGCSRRPGGVNKCCTGRINTLGRNCTDRSDVACSISGFARSREDGWFSGRACKMPCESSDSPDHCRHVKASASLFDDATRASLETACKLAASTRPDEDPTCPSTDDPVLQCGQLSPSAWVEESSAELILRSAASAELDGSVCQSTWCPGVLMPCNASHADGANSCSARGYADNKSCDVRLAVLEGKSLRCGYDEQAQQCLLWVGAALQAASATDGTRHATADDCVPRIESIAECAVDDEDVCAAVGRDIADARAACAPLMPDAAMHAECIFDFCASDGDDDVVALTEIVREIDRNETVNRPPAQPPSPPEPPPPSPQAPPAPPPVLPTPMAPSQCVTSADGDSFCVAIPAAASLDEARVRDRIERHLGLRKSRPVTLRVG